ncbi:hypothetical protein ACO0RG_004464 [Hanseniaspora osmophila]
MSSMEYIKVARVDNVILHKRGTSTKGVLHLTTHHLIFTSPETRKEFWLPYHLIHSVFKNKGSALLALHRNDLELWEYTNIKIITKDLLCFSLDFTKEINSQDVFDSIYNLTALKGLQNLYCFLYKANQVEQQMAQQYNITPFHTLFNIENEFIKRQEIPKEFWRISDVNADFKVCPTYPKRFVVPSSVSDTLLKYATKYRSSCRIPVLSYYHKETGACIVRSSQPLPGITQQRSSQDEKLVEAFFFNTKNCKTDNANNSTGGVVKPWKNIIVDCRPTTNAYAQVALGGGTENMDNYNFNNTTSRMFLGIPNIHAIRESFQNLIDGVVVDNDLNLSIPPKYKMLHDLGTNIAWFKHIRNLLQSTDTLVRHIVFNQSNLLIHCSDGWDRTAQISSLVELCVDPYYRTLEGFMVLVEKEWYNFGHRFMERCNHTNSGNKLFHDNVVTTPSKTESPNQKTNKASNDESNSNKNDDGSEAQELTTQSNTATGLSNMLNSVTLSLKEKKKYVVDEAGSSKLHNILGNNSSPIFFQFVDCVFQLLHQNSHRFEFNERFLRRLVYHLYSCQYGTFVFNNEKQRFDNETLFNKTTSVWCYFLSRRQEFTNPNYTASNATLDVAGQPCSQNTSVSSSTVEEDDYWILPDYNNIKWWHQLIGRKKDDFVEQKEDIQQSNSNEGNGDAITKKHGKLMSYAFKLDMFKS